MSTETIDATIGGVETLFHTLTGRVPPPVGETPYAAIPPERSPDEYVNEQLDRLMKSLNSLSARPAMARHWMPPIAVWEDARELVIDVDLPGVPRDQVTVSLQHGALEVRGERPVRFGNGQDRTALRHDESARGPFRRIVPLPPTVSPEEIRARLADGVLQIRIARAETDVTAGRTIPLQ